MESIYYYLCIFSFLIGVYFGSLYSVNIVWISIFFIILMTLIFLFFPEVFFVAIIFSLGISLGVLRVNLYHDSNQSLLNNQDNQVVTLMGQVIDEADVRNLSVMYKVKIEDSNELIRISTAHFPRFEYGDIVRVTGKLESPDNFKNENGKEFDYISFLSKDNIFYTMYRPNIELIEEGNFSLKRFLFFIKQKLIDGLNRILVPPQAPLAAGLILGAKQALGKDLLDKFRKVGLIHIVVLSGYNIAIVVAVIKRSLSFLPRTWSFIFGSISILLFALLTGAGATIVRASIMVFLAMWSEFIYRKYAINRSLFLAAFLMVLINPRILLSDPGFQLSFVATLGLVHLSPLVVKLFPFLTEKFGIKEIVSSTLATQIAVLPLLINMTGEISTVALIVNIIVLPIIPLTMLLGFFTSLFGIFFVPLGFVPGFLVNLLLVYQIEVVKWFSELSFVVWKL